MSDNSAVPQPPSTYAFRPSLLGAPYEFRLTERGLDWNAGRQAGFIAWSDVERVRMSFYSMQQHRYVTEIWGKGSPKLKLISSSWKSGVLHERLDKPYAAFVTELHCRLARVQSRARFEQGTNPARFWPGLALFVVVSLAFAWMTAQALQGGMYGGALFIAAFLAVFLWRAGDYFRRNRPRLYRPDALPGEVMPRL